MQRLIVRLATFSALLGGLVLIALILMTCASILGRALSPLGTGPVPGDFELTEMGTALVVFAFLPLAQLNGSHAVVDLLYLRLPARIRRLLMLLWDLLLAVTMALILWRLFAGMLDRRTYGDTSYLLRVPLWWAYSAALVPVAAGAVVAAWCVIERIRALAAGREPRIPPEDAEA